MRTGHIGVVSFLLVALAASSAAAEEAPQINLTAPPPAEPEQRTFHVHDGFYMRLNLGLGRLSTAFDVGAPSDVEASGGTLAIDALFGGSPSTGFSMGGGIFTETLPSADVELDGSKLTEADISVAMVGFFVDGFPDAKGGWHLGGALGPAAVTVQRFSEDDGDDGRTSSGFGLAAWGGYQAWVADDWSLGGLLRVMATRTTDSEDNAAGTPELTATTTSVTLMFSALYH